VLALNDVSWRNIGKQTGIIYQMVYEMMQVTINKEMMQKQTLLNIISVNLVA